MALQIDSRVSTPVALSSKALGSVDVAPSSSSAPSVPTQSTPTQSTSAPIDTVKLSLSAHIHLLKSQGQGPKAIAVSLGVPASTITPYFSGAQSTSSQTVTASIPSLTPDTDVETAKAATPATQPAVPVPTVSAK